jgi:hypothetical protein
MVVYPKATSPGAPTKRTVGLAFELDVFREPGDDATGVPDTFGTNMRKAHNIPDGMAAVMLLWLDSSEGQDWCNEQMKAR